MEWVKESYYVRTLCLYCLPLAVAIGTVKALAMYLGVFLSMHDGYIDGGKCGLPFFFLVK